MRKPPKHVYAHTVTLKKCSAIDQWRDPTFTETTISNVCVQPTHDTIRTKDNTEVQMQAVIFIDSLYSRPFVDMVVAQDTSEANGHAMIITFGTHDYTVAKVETLFDEFGRVDHYEVECL